MEKKRKEKGQVLDLFTWFGMFSILIQSVLLGLAILIKDWTGIWEAAISVIGIAVFLLALRLAASKLLKIPEDQQITLYLVVIAVIASIALMLAMLGIL